MILSTQNIRDVVIAITQQLDNIGESKIYIQHDFYWDIPKNQKYDNHSMPTDFTIGQLSDDYEEIHKILQNKTQSVGYSLVWLGALLRAAGESTQG